MTTAARQGCRPAFFVRADGITTGRLRRNVPGQSLRNQPAGTRAFHHIAAVPTQIVPLGQA
jgi:hypothetical protein